MVKLPFISNATTIAILSRAPTMRVPMGQPFSRENGKQKSTFDFQNPNACTLVPTVFLRHLKTKFEFPFSFSVFLRFRKTEFKLLFSFSVFLRRRKTEFEIILSYFVFLNHWKIELRTSIFAFRFPTT